MKFIHFLMMIMGLVPLYSRALPQWTADERTPTFCVQNFNAYGPIYAPQINERSSRAVSFLQSFPKCDIIHLQEVWNSSQIAVFETSLSTNYLISSPNKWNKIGLMSFYLGDINQEHTEFFSVNNQQGLLDNIRELFNVKKAFHVSQVLLPHLSEQIYFINTHLHPTDQAVRLTQILQIIQWRLHHQDLKMILSGDFNADINSLERQLLLLGLGARDSVEESFGGQYPTNYCTYCRENPLGWSKKSHTFDYILYSNISDSAYEFVPENAEINMTGSPQHPWSDHYGIRVNFKVLPSQEKVSSARIEKRRAYLQQVLEVTEKVLKKNLNPRFVTSLEFIDDWQQQLKSQSGHINEYFERYR